MTSRSEPQFTAVPSAPRDVDIKDVIDVLDVPTLPPYSGPSTTGVDSFDYLAPESANVLRTAPTTPATQPVPSVPPLALVATQPSAPSADMIKIDIDTQHAAYRQIDTHPRHNHDQEHAYEHGHVRQPSFGHEYGQGRRASYGQRSQLSQQSGHLSPHSSYGQYSPHSPHSPFDQHSPQTPPMLRVHHYPSHSQQSLHSHYSEHSARSHHSELSYRSERSHRSEHPPPPSASVYEHHQRQGSWQQHQQHQRQHSQQQQQHHLHQRLYNWHQQRPEVVGRQNSGNDSDPKQPTWKRRYKRAFWVAFLWIAFWSPVYAVFTLAWVLLTAIVSFVLFVIPPIGYAALIASIWTWRILGTVEIRVCHASILPPDPGSPRGVMPPIYLSRMPGQSCLGHVIMYINDSFTKRVVLYLPVKLILAIVNLIFASTIAVLLPFTLAPFGWLAVREAKVAYSVLGWIDPDAMLGAKTKEKLRDVHPTRSVHVAHDPNAGEVEAGHHRSIQQDKVVVLPEGTAQTNISSLGKAAQAGTPSPERKMQRNTKNEENAEQGDLPERTTQGNAKDTENTEDATNAVNATDTQNADNVGNEEDAENAGNEEDAKNTGNVGNSKGARMQLTNALF